MMRAGAVSGVAAMIVAVFVICASAGAQDRVDFARDVLPILQDRCFRCHQEPGRNARGRMTRPKGQLRLDGRYWIEKGGATGPALVPGDPAKSLLASLVALPAGDEDRMPAKGDPLSPAEIDVIRRWVDGGADFGGWTGKPGPDGATRYVRPNAERAPDSTASAGATARYAALAEGLAPAPRPLVDSLSKSGARITPLAPDVPLVRVEFPGVESTVGDDVVKSLAPLGDWIAILDLRRTRITDRALKSIGRMPRLVRLDLGDTDVGDQGLLQLRRMPSLRVLNLYATGVGDAGLQVLAGLKSLEAVYLWESKVTPEGVARLRKLLPKTRVVHAPDFPAPDERPQQRGRRRRR